MVDEAHGTGTLGPGGRGAVADAGLEDEVDVIVGTLGKALGSYGAYVCCEPHDGQVPGQHGRTLIFSTRSPARRGRGEAALACCAEPRRVDKLPPKRRRMREALAEHGHPTGTRRPRSSRWSSATPRRRSGCASARSKKACSRRRSGRRPCPKGPRACGWPSWPRTPGRNFRRRRGASLARSCGQPPCVARPVEAARRPDPRPHVRRPAQKPPDTSAHARAIRHRNRHRGRQDGGGRRRVRRAGDAAIRSPPSSPSSRASTSPPATGHPTTSCSRRAASAGQHAGGRGALPLRPGGVPHCAAEMAGETSSRTTGCRCAGAGRGRALVVEGVGGLLVPLASGLPGARLRGGARPAGRDRRPPRSRHDQPHAAHDRSGPGRRPSGHAAS